MRPPRVLSKSDGNILENTIKQRINNINIDTTFTFFRPIDSINASQVQLNCLNEKEIEEYTIRHINMLDPNLHFLNNQVLLDDGSRIDILAENNEKAPVIIEIKKGTADDSTLAQICTYLYQYKKQHPNRHPIGMIVLSDASYRLKIACENIGIEILFYGDILFKNN